MQETAHTK